MCTKRKTDPISKNKQSVEKDFLNAIKKRHCLRVVNITILLHKNWSSAKDTVENVKFPMFLRDCLREMLCQKMALIR